MDELDEKFMTEEFQSSKRSRLGIENDAPLIGIMPGSRKGELDLNFHKQLQVAQGIHEQFPTVRFAVLVAPTVEKEEIQNRIEGFEKVHKLSFPFVLVKDEPLAMIAPVDIMLATSGTATLMVGLMLKPMVIMYNFKPLTYILATIIS